MCRSAPASFQARSYRRRVSSVNVDILDHDPTWHDRFVVYGSALRRVLAARALRIDHIGSTAIPGLGAKPTIDIQVSVADFEPFPPMQLALEGLGWRFHPDNDDRRKRYFTLEDGDARLSNLHMRRLGEFSQQAALLLRDYLRSNETARAAYEREKRRLAQRTWPTIDHYADAKTDVVWGLLLEADRWSWRDGWSAGPSDL